MAFSLTQGFANLGSRLYTSAFSVPLATVCFTEKARLSASQYMQKAIKKTTQNLCSESVEAEFRIFSRRLIRPWRFLTPTKEYLVEPVIYLTYQKGTDLQVTSNIHHH